MAALGQGSWHSFMGRMIRQKMICITSAKTASTGTKDHGTSRVIPAMGMGVTTNQMNLGEDMDAVSKAIKEIILDIETKKGMSMLESLGVSFQNEDGSYKGLLQIFEEAAEKLSQLDD